jgi:4-diphosphocytidyl-2-C-methyl-D-erythritol kinase
MGGGSADAAATLLACDALWDTGLSRDELAHVGKDLGADVPFALLGGAAVGLGVGDQLTPALAKARMNWVLVPAEFGLSTPEVFQALDKLRCEAAQDAAEPTAVEPRILQAMRAGDAGALRDVLGNDLQQASLALAPQLARTLELGERCGAMVSLVSGSGPTIAFLAPDEESSLNIADRLISAGLPAIPVHGPVHGAKIISDTLL